MKSMKRVFCLLILTVLLATLLTTAVLADETAGAWLSVTENPDGTVTACLVTTGAATDGVVTLHYGSTALTYSSLEVNEACVSQYAVNPNGDGTVRISWVGQCEADSNGQTVLTVTFTGADASSLILTGTVYSEDGSILMQIQEDPGNSDTGDQFPMKALIIGMCVALAGIIVIVTIMIRKGRKE